MRIREVKRIILIICIINFLVCMNACYIPYQGERPSDFSNTKWVSEDPDIWFYVYFPHGDETKGTLQEGEYNRLGEKIEVEVSFDAVDGVYIVGKIQGEYKGSTFGRCDFSPDKMVVTIDEEKNTLLDDEYDTITFIRVPDETESESK